MKPYLAQVTFYHDTEPIAIDVLSLMAESSDEAEVLAFEEAETMVHEGTWDYGHDSIAVELL